MPGEVKAVHTGVYSFPDFLPPAHFYFSTREFDAAKDLPFFLHTVGADRERYSTVEQVHGNRVLVMKKGETSWVPIPEADGLITDEKGEALVIRTADCVPVFILDPDRPAIGLVHAGWRGAQKKILSEAIDLLQHEYKSRPSNLRVAMGPSICRKCYEVGDEFRDYFPTFVQKRAARNFFNLQEALKHELSQKGVPPGSIVESGFCTACSVDQFFSARKEGTQTGRLISAAVLKYAP